MLVALIVEHWDDAHDIELFLDNEYLHACSFSLVGLGADGILDSATVLEQPLLGMCPAKGERLY